MHFNTFLENLLKLVINESCVSSTHAMDEIQVQSGQFWFHTLNWTFVLC